MTIPYELFISLKYLRAKRKQKFISLITALSIIGVMVGVMTLIIVLSVMSGFEREVRTRILDLNAHIFVFNLKGPISDYQPLIDKVKREKGVIGVAPFINSQVLIKSDEAISGAVLRGVEVESISEVSNLAKILKAGSIEALASYKLKEKRPFLILGEELAKTLGVVVGARVSLISPFGEITPLGQIPKVRHFLVGGIFSSGMYEYDSSLIYVSLKEAQAFLNLEDEVSGLELRINDLFEAKEMAKAIQDKLGFPFWTKNWIEMNKSFFSALKLEKITMFIILSLIIMVAALNIGSSLIMMVMEKLKDIAILKTMGATDRNIMKIFVYQGLIIGFLGGIIGGLGGIGACLLLKEYQFIQLPKDIYTISTLPVALSFKDIIAIALGTILLSFLATIYPAWQAAKLDPVEAIRYE